MPRSKNKRNVEECHEAVGDVDGGEDKGKGKGEGECEETTNPKTCSTSEPCSASEPCSTLQEKEEEEEDTNASSTKDSTEPAKKKPRKNPTKTDQKDKDEVNEKEKEKGKESTSQISKNRFVNNAEEFEFTIDGHKHVMKPKLFKSGSVGWQYSGKAKETVDGKPLSTQCTVLAVVTKSKQWPESCGDPSKECQEEKECDDKEKEKEKEHNEEEAEEEHEEEEHEKEKEDSSTTKMTRSDFLSKAQNIAISGFEKEITLKPKKFKTKSVGWYSSSKSHKLFDGVNLLLQVGITFNVVRSKTWDE